MDIATLVGLIVGTAVIVMAILSGSDFSIFINVPGLLIVFGGTIAATLIKFSLKDCFSSFVLAIKKAFWEEVESPHELIETAMRLTSIAREKGLIALDGEEISNPFMEKGVSLCVDGHKPAMVSSILTKEMNYSIARHDVGEQIFRGIGESAPAFGMIGTLVGLVQMLSSMEDPSSIGPAMAVALLTTLYGALIANFIALPIAEKLSNRSVQERLNKSLILESVLGIQRTENPRILAEILESFIPSADRRHGREDERRQSDEKTVDSAQTGKENA